MRQGAFWWRAWGIYSLALVGLAGSLLVADRHVLRETTAECVPGSTRTVVTYAAVGLAGGSGPFATVGRAEYTCVTWSDAVEMLTVVAFLSLVPLATGMFVRAARHRRSIHH